MIRLFHSYQYIANSKDIVYDKTTKQFKNCVGNFILGLLQIPEIPNYDIVLEKYLISKRQSKKVQYRNHTKHNMRIFLVFSEEDIEKFIIKIIEPSIDDYFKLQQLNYLFNILRKNYHQTTLEHNIFDLICVNNMKTKNLNCLDIKNLELVNNNYIKIGNISFDLINKTYQINIPKNTLSDLEILSSTPPFEKSINKKYDNLNIDFTGGIIYTNYNHSSKNKLLSLFENVNYLTLLFEDRIEFNIWIHYIKNDDKFNHYSLLTYQYFDNSFCKYIIQLNKNKNKVENTNNNESILLCFSNNYNYNNYKKFSYKHIEKIVEKEIYTLWIITNSNNFFKISNLVNLIDIFSKSNISLNKEIFYNSYNIYQLTKLIYSFTNISTLSSKDNAIKEINIKKKNLNIIRNFNIFLKNTTLPENTSCSLCFQSNLTFIKTNCNHIYCLRCYREFINIKIINNEDLNCCLCNNSLKDKELIIYNDTENLNIFKNLENIILKNNFEYFILFYEIRNKEKIINNSLENILKYFLYKYKYNSKVKVINQIDKLIKLENYNDEKSALILDLYNENKENKQKLKNYGFNNLFNIVSI